MFPWETKTMAFHKETRSRPAKNTAVRWRAPAKERRRSDPQRVGSRGVGTALLVDFDELR
jgi:hypothetical protein